MEELTNNVSENLEVEVIEPVEVLEVIENEEIKKSSNKTVIGFAIGATITVGIYGVKKFIDWRKSKKKTSEETYIVDKAAAKVDAEVYDPEEDI